MSGGDTGFGLVYQIALKGQGWVFNTLYNFAGGSGGSSPGTPIVGPEGTLYGTANGGMQNCGQNHTDYCGLIYSLRPAPTPCTTSSCPWTKSMVYQPTGNNDAYDPGNLVFDEAGNLYGTSGSGGAYGQGAVFELTPSNGGWTETILYNFTGGSDGGGPSSLTLGSDGNLYGTRWWQRISIWHGVPVSASTLRGQLDGECDLQLRRPARRPRSLRPRSGRPWQPGIAGYIPEGAT